MERAMRASASSASRLILFLVFSSMTTPLNYVLTIDDCRLKTLQAIYGFQIPQQVPCFPLLQGRQGHEPMNL